MKLIAVGSLFVSLLVAPAPHAAPLNYDLAQALKSALERRPEVLEKRERVAEAEAAVDKDWRTLSPTLVANLNAYEKKDAASNTNSVFKGEAYNSYQMDLLLSAPLIRGGGIWSELGRVDADLESKRVDLAIAERDLGLKVARNFFAILLADTQYKTYLAQEETRTEELRTARNRFKVGNERELAVLQIETELALLKPQTLAAKNRLTLAMTDFAYIVGESDKSLLRIHGSLDAPDWDTLSARLKKSMSFSKLEIRSQELAVEILEKSKPILMASHWPSLTAVADFGRDGNTKSGIFDTNNSRWYLGLQFSVPLFSGLSSLSDRRILAAQESAARIREKLARDTAANQQSNTEKSLETAREVVKLSNAAHELAHKAVSIAKKHYGLGIATYTQYSDAVNNDLQAELSLETARQSYLLSMVDYFAASGWPLQELVAGLRSQP